MANIRVLHCVVNMNRGGTESLLMNVYRNINRSNVQFDFLTSRAGVFDAEIEKLGGRVYRIPYVNEIGHFKYVKNLNDFFRNHHYQIVHAHMDKMSGLVLRAAKKNGVKIRIAHSHSTKSAGNMPVRLYKWMIGRLINKNATHLMACSTNAAKWLYQSQSEKATIINNGIEYELFKFSIQSRKETREKLGISDDTFVIGHVGRFDHAKNQSFIIDIFQDLIKIRPDSVLILVGEGVLFETIKYKVKKLQLDDKVKLLGLRNDVPQLLQAFDVFVFPSRFEGFPLSLVEAQAAGLPCVVSNVVTEEVRISDSVYFLSLKEGSRVWASEIVSICSKNTRREAGLLDPSFDIWHTSNMLEQLYIDLGKTK